MSAEPLPPPLKIPEVSRFINRANQLRTIKPAIAYWCEYHAVNQIVTKSLHTADDDCFAYTKALIERLEATKAERPEDDAIVDNTAGQAYVEQFAQETFTRAERTMQANKVTRQTADTFDAAATFFDLTHEWGTPEPDVLQKIKFAKWNAARILRAIREGKDPNESNPQIQENELTERSADLDEAALHEISSHGDAPRAVSVEDVPDAGESAVPHSYQESYFPPTTSGDQDSFAPSPVSPSSGPTGSELPQPAPEQVSPVPSPEQIPMQPSPQIPTKVPSQFAPPAAGGSSSTPSAWTGTYNAPPPEFAPVPGPPPAAPAAAPVPVSREFPSATGAPAALAPSHKNIEQAQKHAKWAISALNFEDVSTAVQELRNALAMLGSQQ